MSPITPIKSTLMKRLRGWKKIAVESIHFARRFTNFEGEERRGEPITVNKTRSSYEEFRGAMDSFSTDVEKFNARVGIDVLRAQNVVSEIVSNGVKYVILIGTRLVKGMIQEMIVEFTIDAAIRIRRRRIEEFLYKENRCKNFI